MSISNIKERIGDFAKDVKINLSNVLKEEGAPGLTQNQILGVALACSYTTKNQDLINEVLNEAKETLSDSEVKAAKSAASIMGMNNIYYRFLHLASDKEFQKMPAKLRMQVIANSGVDKKDFELYSLAISAITGCGMCINAHVETLKKEGVSHEGIQSSVRIASVINSAAQALSIY